VRLKNLVRPPGQARKASHDHQALLPAAGPESARTPCRRLCPGGLPALDSFRSTDQTTQHSIDAELTIADCGRVAALDFCVSDDRGAQNALHKARLLRDVVVESTTALEAALDDGRDQQT
jgi:hypothetical protein